MTKFIGIMAQDESNAIGLNGGMAWDDKDDLKHFYNITVGHTVVMGYSTFKGLGVLKERTNIVISATKRELPDGVIQAYSIESLRSKVANTDKCFIIGGAKLCLGCFYDDLFDGFYLTEIKGVHKADTYMNIFQYLTVSQLSFTGFKYLSRSAEVYKFERQ